MQAVDHERADPSQDFIIDNSFWRRSGNEFTQAVVGDKLKQDTERARFVPMPWRHPRSFLACAAPLPCRRNPPQRADALRAFNPRCPMAGYLHARMPAMRSAISTAAFELDRCHSPSQPIKRPALRMRFPTLGWCTTLTSSGMYRPRSRRWARRVALPAV